ncbi:hypothetical protein [Streptomyces sp. NPDC057545]|uniref:hypothetical protein n=1 Tax=Streptomyces sp. NPDC057545 TaxID=3346164 RepID=UPI003676C221
MTKEQAVEAAAAAVIEHGGPEALTDPHIVTTAMGVALGLGATHEDIRNEMRRQRGEL